MTKQELIQEIEKATGMVVVRDLGRELEMAADTGRPVVFTVSIYECKGEGWAFGGCGSLLRNQWGPLCRLT